MTYTRAYGLGQRACRLMHNGAHAPRYPEIHPLFHNKKNVEIVKICSLNTNITTTSQPKFFGIVLKKQKELINKAEITTPYYNITYTLPQHMDIKLISG